MAKVMIIDGGARGHALALAYRGNHPHFKKEEEVFVAPGNKGMENNFVNREFSLWEDSINIVPTVSLKDPNSILEAARIIKPDLVDVAQDDALALGTVDLLQQHGFNTFGPTRKAAQIEWDKGWAREFMQRHNIPHPEFRTFQKIIDLERTNRSEVISYASQLLDRSGIVFLKASGLYAGKGVVSATNMMEVREALSEIYKMGSASQTFLVEEGMRGEEFSYYALVKGTDFACFQSAQDNKRVWNGDKGQNTGGMGANSPALVTKGLERRIEDEIIRPTVEGLASEGRPYNGILYLGGMVCEDGSIKVVEFNSRWGDPECQVILPALKGKSKNYFKLITAENLSEVTEIGDGRSTIEQDGLARVCIVGASVGYPGNYEQGKKISFSRPGLNPHLNAYLLSAGINVVDGQMYTRGGRVLNVLSGYAGAGDKTVSDARVKALQKIACISIEGNGLHYRTDIAWRDVEREQKRAN